MPALSELARAKLEAAVLDPILLPKLFRVWFECTSAAFINAPRDDVLTVLRNLEDGPATLSWQITIGEVLLEYGHHGEGVDERSVRGRLGDLKALRDRLTGG